MKESPTLREPRVLVAQEVFDGSFSASFHSLLTNSLAVVFRDFLSEAECRSLTERIYELRPLWLDNYGGEQHSLGRIWYTHFDDGLRELYFAEADGSKQVIDTHFPGLYDRILQFCSSLTGGEPVTLRHGWAGPGFVIFPANGRCAEIGGDIHYDWEGLTDGQLDDPQAQAYSFISVLQLPQQGGGLHIWPLRYDPTRKSDEIIPKKQAPSSEALRLNYRVGDLLLINSFSLHQIQPFAGDVDRICLTFHIARHQNVWYIWF